MAKILDLYIGESDVNGKWTGLGDKYVHENPRLVTAIVRRFIESEIRHSKYNRVNIVFSEGGTGVFRQVESTFSKKWFDIWYGVSTAEFNSSKPTERERTTADAIFNATIYLFGKDSPEGKIVDSIRQEFDAYYETKIARFKCRSKQTKTYRVDVDFTINWGTEKPFWVASVTYEEFSGLCRKRRVSFPLRGTDNDIFCLCGRIAVSQGKIVLHPRPAEVTYLKRLKYDTPYRIEIDKMNGDSTNRLG